MTIDNFGGRHDFLSNFYPVLVKLPGRTGFRAEYPSVEHAYQAAKTLDDELRKPFQQPIVPGLAKRMGRRLKVRDDWEEPHAVKRIVMHYLLVQKFEHPELALKLLETRPHDLIEGNWWNDTYWGVCRGVGENWLGRILMLIRDQLGAFIA